MTGPFALPPDEMRRLGYRVIDRIVEHLEGIGELPPVRVGDPEALRERLGGPPPEQPGDPEAELDVLFDEVLPWIQHGDHPRFFARIGSPSNYIGALADAAAAGLNVFSGSWTGGSGPAAVELVVLDWLRDLCGLPDGAEGVLTTGGSVANLTGLAAMRTARGPGVVYVSDQAHAAVPRALRVLGLQAPRVLESDGEYRLDPRQVRSAIAADRAAGRRPVCVVASAGTTSSGSVDPIDALAELCADEGLWLHVDGAYGAPAVLWPPAQPLLAGLERADSLVLDPHKWLFQPYEIGCVLVREPGLLERTFALEGVYLRDTLTGAVDFRNRSVQLTRGARALKLWLSIRVFGLAAFREAVGRGIALAEHAEALLRARPGWEVVGAAQLAIVCFRREGDDARQTRIVDAMTRDGFALPSTTVLGGQVVLRLCTINPRTTEEDVERTIERMSEVA
jgi:glutamate/tyrosine decarboxylase-like PLP-dependent enzyme